VLVVDLNFHLAVDKALILFSRVKSLAVLLFVGTEMVNGYGVHDLLER